MIVRLEIKKIGINGEGIGYYEKKPVFVEGCLIGEIVQCEIKNNGNYFVGKLLKIIKESKDRVICQCDNYQNCQACSLMMLRYQKQLDVKRSLVEQALTKYAKVDYKLIEKTVGSDYPNNYRNMVKLPFGYKNNKLYVGMYLPNTNHIIPLNDCLIQDQAINEKIKEILSVLNKYQLKKYDQKSKEGLRHLVIRKLADKFQVTLVLGKEFVKDDVINELYELKNIASISISRHDGKSHEVFGENTKVVKGKPRLEFKLGQIKLGVGPRGFFQLNTLQAKKLYELVASLIDNKVNLIVEAYCGIGGISLFVKDKAKEVIGIESEASAITDAKINARINGANHLNFICGDSGKELLKIVEKRKIDIVIVDPPRVGLSDEFIQTVLKSLPSEIIYISCNPSTLGKDLNKLQSKYRIKRVIPFDMFSHTAHVETVVLLSKINVKNKS